MEDDDVRTFMKETIFKEVIPTLSLEKEDCEAFANAVVERFYNPFIKHALLAISLNSVSKWRARCMPSFLKYIDLNGTLPKHLTFSLASLMAFYSSVELREDCLMGYRNGEEYKIRDDKDVLEFFKANSTKETSEFVKAFLSNEKFFGTDLSQIDGLTQKVAGYLDEIKNSGMRTALKDNLK